MKAILVNYNFSPGDWWLEYGYKPEDVTMYDRSDDGIERTFAAKTVIKTPNMGEVDYDKLTYLVENYDTLPDHFLWSKTNIFKYISKEELDPLIHNTTFTPLLTQGHRIYYDNISQVADYHAGIYRERNDSWYFGAMDSRGTFSCWSDWAHYMALPSPAMVPFAPGGSYILTRETVHKYGRDHYEKMRQTLPYARRPVEAALCERSYYLMWK